MVLGNKGKTSFDIHINNLKIKNSNEVPLLGLKLDKVSLLKNTFVNFAEEHRTSLILYVELRSMKPLRKQNYLQMPLSTVSLPSLWRLWQTKWKSLKQRWRYFDKSKRPAILGYWSCVDLFLTSSPNSFQKSTVVEIGWPDFHKFIVTVMKSYSPKRTHL